MGGRELKIIVVRHQRLREPFPTFSRLNMYDNFDLNKCIIVEADEQEDAAMVKFVAELELRSSGEITGFQETSFFERAKTHGGWLYKNGKMEAAPEDLLVRNLQTSKE